MNLTQKILREFELRSYNIFLTLAIKSSKPLNQIKKKEKQKNHPKTLGIKLLVVYSVWALGFGPMNNQHNRPSLSEYPTAQKPPN